ncbi:enoyl-CoA hydratase/isomerase family protein [Bordetella trematum]|uniref:enoyl-CoA hydratase/isomerase family protein n=1 Tax=Bordetella trematum TaxID=123899 RepID=UPI000D8533F9|nr:enoyl-CoA hydratase/isomerase family protein [Bordetella trematum]SPU50324.1 enoyl-CoA hydratase/isomerase [Bordetella trematum]VDH08066.1 Probable enoyl-CoA hydratase echA8 [Bordetella trematum]
MSDIPEYTTLRLEIESGIATLWLARPESRNALNAAMCAELVESCQWLEQCGDVRVIVVRGQGVAFCAGADLKERQGMSQAEMVARRVAGFTAYAAIEALSKPVIAAVHGPAFGSGCEIAAACDFVLASGEAAFKYPEVGWGTVGATQRLPRIVGRRMAKELLFTGRLVDAREALQLGLVNHVFDSDQFENQVMALASQIAAANPVTVSLTKRSIDGGLETTREGAMAVELLAIQENLRRSDWQKAIAGFGRKEGNDAAH